MVWCSCKTPHRHDAVWLVHTTYVASLHCGVAVVHRCIDAVLVQHPHRYDSV
jgi:hypothetical protein